MGLFDSSKKLFIEKINLLEENLNKEINKFNELKKDLDNTKQELIKANFELSKFQSINDVEVEVNKRKSEFEKTVQEFEHKVEIQQIKLDTITNKFEEKKTSLIELEEKLKIYSNELEFVEYGLYEPIFNYETSEEYKEALKRNYNKQKTLLKENKAITSNEDEIYFQSKYKFLTTSYKKSISSYKKLISNAFNSECDAIISKVRWDNIEKMKDILNDIFYRINSNSREFCGFLLLQNSIVNGITQNDSFNKQYSNHMIEITKEFLDLKLEELALNHEYHIKKQNEKEEERRIKELMREEEKARKEYEKAERDAEIQESKVQKAIDEARKLLKEEGADYNSLNEKIAFLERKLSEVQELKARALSMAQQTKRGFIYIISNIGSFGENVYKIGMTRRLEPTDRVRELGDASVPFQFDIHAMIFSENAPSLEYELHKAFADKKLNQVNYKKEFFKITLDEIESKIKDLNLNVEFIKIPEAMQYRESINKIKNQY
jgi:hypothetical protein